MPSILAVLALAAATTEIEVRIEGVENAMRDNVVAALSMERYRELPELNETMVRRLHARARDEVATALQPFGYYEPVIESELELRGSRWIATYRITPGVPVRIESIDVAVTGPGRESPVFAVPPWAPKPGDPLRHAAYERLKSHYLNAAANNGYLDARFTTHAMRVSVAAKSATIELRFETGERYRFGPITLQQDILDPDFVERYLQFEQGDPYSVGELLSLQYALTDSEYYGVVEVDARRENAVNLEIPVTVTMEPRARHRYTVGFGYATDTGPRGILGFENRRVNARGHRLHSDLKLSQVLQSLETRYLIPLENPVWERFTLAGAVAREEVGDIQTERVELVGAYTTREDRRQRTLSVRVLRERDELAGGASSRTQLIPGVEWLISGGATGKRPRHGHRMIIGFSASDPSLGAPTRFLQARGRIRLMRPVGDQDRFILRGEIGATYADELTRLVATQRFFAGGDQSVRGYGYNSLGPTNALGEVIGGRYLVTFGAEWEHWLTDSWGIAFFADTGNAFNDFDEGFKTGAGIGLRWQLPFGVVAFDLAHPFDDPKGRSVRFHLNLGSDL